MNHSLSLLVLLVLLPVALPASAVTRYVDVNSTNPVPPYTNWATAANVIQNAVDAADPGDEVLVSNGVYATGGKAIHGTMTNRVAVDKPLTLLSVNGPEFTIIQGYQVPGTTNGDGAIRCVYLTNGTSLSGFTLMNGATRTSGDITNERSGGGLFCESTEAWVSNCKVEANSALYFGGGSFSGTLRNCTIVQNKAVLAGGGACYGALESCTVISNSLIPMGALTSGGGAYGSTLSNCEVVGNKALRGGGAASSTLYNCTVTANSADQGGGVSSSVLYNCIVYFNTARFSGNNSVGGSENYTCTVPQATNGIGNITNAPLFVDTNGWADLRLQPDSPCINAGNNAYVTSTNDLDGNSRIVGGTVDMGAYEFQAPQSVISYAWLQQYNLPTDGSADFAHSDADPHNNYQEWKAWTDPTDELSFLRMLTPEPGTNGTVVSWQSVAGHRYFVERADDAAGSFSLIQSNITGQSLTTSFTDTNAADSGAAIYRVGVPE